VVLKSHSALINMMNLNPEYKVYIIDDDESVRRGLSLLLKSHGYIVEAFEKPLDFLEFENITGPGCILLDIFLKGESGLDFQDLLIERYNYLPVIYISGHGDIAMSVKTLKKGAINFIEKPLDDIKLLAAVNEAIVSSKDLILIENERDYSRKKLNTLTPRELEVFSYVIKGMLNKQISSKLDIAEHTVKLHRGKITSKLGVKSVPEMVYIAEKSGYR